MTLDRINDLSMITQIVIREKMMRFITYNNNEIVTSDDFNE